MAGAIRSSFNLGRLLEARRSDAPVLLWSLTALGVAGALLLVRRFAPEAASSGIQEIEGALDGVRPLRWARVLIACATADVVVRAMLGDALAFEVGDFPMPPLPGLFGIAIFGIVIGVFGRLFNASIVWTQDGMGKLGRGGRLATGIAIGAFVGAMAQLAPDLAGGGYGAIRDVLSGSVPQTGLLLLFAGRFALTVICFASGVPGGIFAPMVALGTIFGLWFAGVVPGGWPAAQLDPGVFMVAGAGALFAATVRAPITGIVLAAELTGNFQLILPVTIACVSATLVAHALGGRPIYTVLLERELEASST